MAPTGLLQLLLILDQVLDDITMDFIEGLPKSQVFNSILVVVNHLSKYSHFIALKYPFTAQSVALLFFKEVICLHGIPRSIILDQEYSFYEFLLV